LSSIGPGSNREHKDEISYYMHSAMLIESAHETPTSAEKQIKLEFGMYPQSMPTEWTHARTLRPWQSVRLDL